MERDLLGYGRNRPTTSWPNGAKIAVNFVINYEEGSELSPLNIVAWISAAHPGFFNIRWAWRSCK